MSNSNHNWTCEAACSVSEHIKKCPYPWLEAGGHFVVKELAAENERLREALCDAQRIVLNVISQEGRSGPHHDYAMLDLRTLPEHIDNALRKQGGEGE